MGRPTTARSLHSHLPIRFGRSGHGLLGPKSVWTGPLDLAVIRYWANRSLPERRTIYIAAESPIPRYIRNFRVQLLPLVPLLPPPLYSLYFSHKTHLLTPSRISPVPDRRRLSGFRASRARTAPGISWIQSSSWNSFCMR